MKDRLVSCFPLLSPHRRSPMLHLHLSTVNDLTHSCPVSPTLLPSTLYTFTLLRSDCLGFNLEFVPYSMLLQHARHHHHHHHRPHLTTTRTPTSCPQRLWPQAAQQATPSRSQRGTTARAGRGAAPASPAPPPAASQMEEVIISRCGTAIEVSLKEMICFEAGRLGCLSGSGCGEGSGRVHFVGCCCLFEGGHRWQWWRCPLVARDKQMRALFSYSRQLCFINTYPTFCCQHYRGSDEDNGGRHTSGTARALPPSMQPSSGAMGSGGAHTHKSTQQPCLIRIAGSTLRCC